jgi:hypothetical protein
MATPCLTDAGGRKRIGGSFGRVERVRRVGDQRKREAMVCKGVLLFWETTNLIRTNKTIWNLTYVFGENILYQLELGSNSYPEGIRHCCKNYKLFSTQSNFLVYFQSVCYHY